MDKSVLIFFKNLRDLLKLRDQTPILPKKIGPLIPRLTGGPIDQARYINRARFINRAHYINQARKNTQSVLGR